jgi:hypothetical protein
VLRSWAFRGERGQASPEWLGLVLFVALLFAAGLTFLGPLTLALSLARSIGDKIVCVAHLSDACGSDSGLVEAYGADLARVVRGHAPEVVYERGMRALPVDYRSCRETACADANPSGLVSRSASGEPATAFVHLIDCRRRSLLPAGGIGAADCSGGRTGNLYLQYWFYYPDSATLRGLPVARERGYHADDWESYGVRVGPDGDVHVRASSHRGYNYSQGPQNWGAESGIEPLRSGAEAVDARSRDGWGPETGVLFVSGGSHAGNAKAVALGYSRLTPARRLRLIPLESIAEGERSAFAITPPWLKQVWRDPEAEGTS